MLRSLVLQSGIVSVELSVHSVCESCHLQVGCVWAASNVEAVLSDAGLLKCITVSRRVEAVLVLVRLVQSSLRILFALNPGSYVGPSRSHHSPGEEVSNNL